MGAEASEVATNLIRIIGNHVRAQKLGRVFGADCGYQIFATDPNRVRYPGGSFIARGRLPNDRAPRGHIQIHPDLAIEVVSPSNRAEDMARKIEQHLATGSQSVWVFYSTLRMVEIHSEQGVHWVREPELVTEERLLPWWSLSLTYVFEGKKQPRSVE